MSTDLRALCLGLSKGSNLGHLNIFVFLFSFMESFVNEQNVLFRVDFLSVTSDHRFQCNRVGLGVKHLEHLKI